MNPKRKGIAMNKQCQQPQAHPDRCGCVREIAEHNAQAYAEAIAAFAAKDAEIASIAAMATMLENMEWAEHGAKGDAAYRIEACITVLLNEIAAKDARIAELEAYICYADEVSTCAEQLLKMIQIDACDVTKDMVAVLRLDAALKELESFDNTCADGDATATHSEDGRELIERYALGGHCDSFGQDCGAEMERDDAGQYMTVAQHSRIVAAKDAEIARLKADDAEAIKRPPYAHICIGMPAALHHDTRKLLERFTHALAVKLRAAEEKYGYSNGWKDAGWMDECRAKLAEHMTKGDPRDVAAYCAFLWHHGESTAQPASQVGGDDREVVGTVADRLDAMADQQPAGSQAQSDLYAAATVWRKHLSAQPARQVGGDEPKVPNYKFKFETLVEHCKRQDQVIAELRYDENIRRFYDDGAVWFWCGDETDNLSTLACPVVINAGDLRELLARAALAPAAVAVVMPDRIICEDGYPSDDWLVANAHNRALDAVARLNRRAITVELLDRVCKDYTGRENWDALEPDRLAAAAELRALLGKEMPTDN